MTLTLTQSATAVAGGRSASFAAVGGTGPYTYVVLPSGAGGSIDTDGVYLAPPAPSSDPHRSFDVVEVTDAHDVTASAQILVGSPLLLVCEIIQRCLGLDDGRVYLWNQKINQPSDGGIYIAVSVPTSRAFANVNRVDAAGSGMNADAYVCMFATVDFDIISRGPDARERKEEVALALASVYAQQQQAANGFSLGRVGMNFLNLSTVDGAAIPYRFRISVNMQYAFAKTTAAPFFNVFDREVVDDDGTVIDEASLVSGDAATPIPEIIDGGDASTVLGG